MHDSLVFAVVLDQYSLTGTRGSDLFVLFWFGLKIWQCRINHFDWYLALRFIEKLSPLKVVGLCCLLVSEPRFPSLLMFVLKETHDSFCCWWFRTERARTIDEKRLWKQIYKDSHLFVFPPEIHKKYLFGLRGWISNKLITTIAQKKELKLCWRLTEDDSVIKEKVVYHTTFSDWP